MMSETKQPGRIKAWLQLLRVPNLLTVPGDPIAGFLLVSGVPYRLGMHLLFGAIICVLVYAAGLIHNDLCDLEEDRRDRPSRPLACGAISTRAAWGAFGILIALAIGMTAGISLGEPASGGYYIPNFMDISLPMLAGLILCVMLYNRFLKKIPVVGALAMGLCRAGSMAFGAVLAFGAGNQYEIHWIVWVFVATQGLYIAAVTFLASDEMLEKRRILSPLLPALVLGAFLAWFSVENLWSYNYRAGGLLCLAVLCDLVPISKLRGVSKPKDVQKQVGWLIRNLIILQAAFAIFVPSPAIWAYILLLWPINALLAKRFYAS